MTFLFHTSGWHSSRVPTELPTRSLLLGELMASGDSTSLGNLALIFYPRPQSLGYQLPQLLDV